MKIDNFNFANDKINVIFTGEYYYFYNTFFGLVCVAKRNYNKESDNKAFFTIYTGNNQASESYNKGILERSKKYINKEENKYIKKDIDYKIADVDLNLCYLDIQIKNR